MPEMLILQMGSTYPDLRSKMGDFDQWILQAMPKEYADLFAVAKDESKLVEPDLLSGVIVSGSHSMVTRPNNWERTVMKWLRKALDADVPILGICYGHQLLAHVKGGVVGYIPKGPELGYQRLHFTGQYERDPLFGLYPSHAESFTFHHQTILRLPLGAESYARSSEERNHAVRYAEWVWGVQYHPEFTNSIAQNYLKHEAVAIERLGKDFSSLLENAIIERPPDPLISRFVDIAMSKPKTEKF